jgi:hypothetical protein
MTDGLDIQTTSTGTLILDEGTAARTASGESHAITSLGGLTALRVEVDVQEVSGMTLGVDPESKEEVEVGPPGLIVVVEETLDGTNWNEIGRLPTSRPTQRQRLITDVDRQTIVLSGPLAETIRLRWIIRGLDVENVETGELEPGKLVSPLFRFSITSPPCWSDA